MNLVLGTAYLRMLYLDMEESYVLATAAYNAGPNRARIWRAAVRNSMEAAAFIETIPYFETREYVKNVLANMHTYAMLTGELDGRFAKLLGRVEQSSRSPVNNHFGLKNEDFSRRRLRPRHAAPKARL